MRPDLGRSCEEQELCRPGKGGRTGGSGSPGEGVRPGLGHQSGEACAWAGLLGDTGGLDDGGTVLTVFLLRGAPDRLVQEKYRIQFESGATF